MGPHTSRAAALVLAAAVTGVKAQSTATQIEEGVLQELEEITVTARYATPTIGVIKAEDATRSRFTVDNAYLATQPAGQSVAHSLNLVPGLNFTNADAYGSSGGNLRMRSFDGGRISLMVDGIQLNDTGNYAIYTGQLLDPEIIESATVNAGTTDVDSPTASATGGTINLRMARPGNAPALTLRPSVGSNDFRRLFVRADTGEFGPWHTTAYATYSFQEYEKFKGPGRLQRQQFNARIFQIMGDGDFLSLSVHYNRGRSHFYRNATAAQFGMNGWDFDFDATCIRTVPDNGTVQDESVPGSSCTNYYNARINPSDTGNIRGQSSFRIASNLRLTVDPSVQYVLANGGGYQALYENDMRLRGDPVVPGVDLNNDGDVIDRIALYTPNNTNTRRHGVNSALLWDLAPGHLLRLSYTFDRAWHRQTGQVVRFDRNGDPENVFGGRNGAPVLTADGTELRRRDRKSIALLKQVSLGYAGRFLDRRLKLNLGLRAPFLERKLNQYCYTPVANPGADPWCTTQAQAGGPDADGHVTLAGGADALYVPAYSGTEKYDQLLPNFGVSLLPWDDENQFFVTYARGFAAPRNDNLYSRQIVQVRPETTNTYELGYRYQGSAVLGTATLWRTDFFNRIVSAWDDEQDIATDRNVGKVDLWGIDAAMGVEPARGLSIYATASYNHSRMRRDIQLDATTMAPTSGKSLVETPDITLGARLQYRVAALALGVQAKYTGYRWANDINTEKTGSYTLVDLDAAYDFQVHGSASSIQLNVLNVFDKRYFGSIGTSIAGAGSYSAGAPRTLQVSWMLVMAGSPSDR